MHPREAAGCCKMQLRNTQLVVHTRRGKTIEGKNVRVSRRHRRATIAVCECAIIERAATGKETNTRISSARRAERERENARRDDRSERACEREKGSRLR